MTTAGAPGETREGLRFRVGVPADLERIVQLQAANWRSAYRGVLSEGYLANDLLGDRRAAWAKRFDSPAANQHVIIAENGAQLVGFVCAFVDAHERWGSYVDNLHVEAAMRGRGVGASLMRNVASWCDGKAAGRGLYLFVTESNRPAREFYSRLGGKEMQSDMWEAPDGSRIPTLLVWWESLAVLAGRPRLQL